VIERTAPILGLVPETERIAQIQQTIALSLNGAVGGGSARAAAPRQTPTVPRVPAALPRPLPTVEPRPAPIRRTDAADGIAMPRLVLHLSPPQPLETGRAPR
jgi:cell division protein FtsI (penicillin-binding protein 3)